MFRKKKLLERIDKIENELKLVDEDLDEVRARLKTISEFLDNSHLVSMAKKDKYKITYEDSVK